MGVERTAKTTPVSPEQVFISLAMAWQSITNTPPDRKVILIIHAQSALETGHWKSISNYNLGGSKRQSFWVCKSNKCSARGKISW